ncbi:MAG: hypothetical protein Q9160_001580 [Pyrenula sp. 1 TL-2023]
MAARCGLTDMPKDVFVHCILPHIVGERDLAALRATASSFSHLVTPKLFARYVNIADVIEPKKSFLPFLRTIAARPDLARHCKVVELRETTEKLLGLDGTPCWDPDLEEPLSVRDRNLFVRAAMQTGIINEDGSRSQNPVDRRFLDDLAAGHEESQMILMFACLPNLGKIIIYGFPDLCFRSLQWSTLLGRVKHGFSRLTEFSAGPYYGLGCAGLTVWAFNEELDFLLRLPSFRVFHGEGVYLHERNPLWKSLPLAKSSITSLQLHSCEVGRNAANALIRSCKALENFEYSWSCGGGEASEDQRFFVKDVREALLLHKRSLRTLYLDFCDYEQREDFIYLGADWVGSLRQFSKLAYLHIDYVRLVGRGSEHEEHDLSAILPNAIEMLSLDYAHDEQWAHEACSDLIRLAQSGHCPNLATVAFPEIWIDSRYNNPEWTNVRKVLEDRGLKLTRCNWGARAEPLNQRQAILHAQLSESEPSAT